MKFWKIGLGILVMTVAMILVGAASAQATVTLPPATAAGQPISWTNTCGTGNSCTFTVYRIAGACPATPVGSAGWTQIATGLTATSTNDASVVSGSTYCYGVEAVNSAGNSAPLTGSTTVPLLPTAPTGLTF